MFDLGEILGILLTILLYGVLGVITVALTALVLGTGVGLALKAFLFITGAV